MIRAVLPHALGVLTLGARALYAVMKLLPVQKKVILITREPRQISADFQLLQESLRRKHPEHRVLVIKHNKLSLSYLGRALREMYHLATCDGCLVDGYIIPVSILKHREDLRIGQIWHALGAIKKFGHLASGRREGLTPRVAATIKMHENYSFICASGSYTAETYAAAFGVPAEMVQPLGMPRVDYLLDDAGNAARRQQILSTHPQLAQGRTVVYVPTFRRGQQVSYQELAAAFDDERGTLVMLPHPADRTPVPKSNGVIVGTGDFGVLDWLSVADVVITDYSAITYEATLRDIPLVFWPYDMDYYLKARGLALDYVAEVPGPIAGSAAEAVQLALEQQETDYNGFRSRHLNFVTNPDGSLPGDPPSCADQIVDALQLRRPSPAGLRLRTTTQG